MDSMYKNSSLGLVNLGATCYINSVLQILYNIPRFRNAIYDYVTIDGTVTSKMIWSLKSLFVKLNRSTNSGSTCSTEELVSSFNWIKEDCCKQEDAHEFKIKFFDWLEKGIRDTLVELFQGTVTTTITYGGGKKSPMNTTFPDLLLEVNECSSIDHSILKYMKKDSVAYENYNDAIKQTQFANLPHILMLTLCCFSHNEGRGNKIKSQCEFKVDLDLNNAILYANNHMPEGVDNLYGLYSILVHEGETIDQGHYFSYINHNLTNNWLLYNDSSVTIVNDINKVIKELCSGTTTCAYILVYVRKSKQSWFCHDHDRILGADELSLLYEQTLKYQSHDSHPELFTKVLIVREKDLHEQKMQQGYYDFVNFEKVDVFDFQKDKTITDVKNMCVKKYGVPSQNQRFWYIRQRENETFRPFFPLTSKDERRTIEDFTSQWTSPNGLILFLEESLLLDPKEVKYEPLHPYHYDKYDGKADKLVFFKIYDAEQKDVSYICKLFVKFDQKISDIYNQLNEKAGFDFEQNVIIEEIGDKEFLSALVDDTFKMKNGDIICFQRKINLPRNEPLECPDFSSYLLNVRNSQGLKRGSESSTNTPAPEKTSKMNTFHGSEVETGKRRVAESATKTSVPKKKSKLNTPQKTDGKKGVHVATPITSKKTVAETPATTKAAASQIYTPLFYCDLCKRRSYISESALKLHIEDMHSGKRR